VKAGRQYIVSREDEDVSQPILAFRKQAPSEEEAQSVGAERRGDAAHDKKKGNEKGQHTLRPNLAQNSRAQLVRITKSDNNERNKGNGWEKRENHVTHIQIVQRVAAEERQEGAIKGR